MCVIGGRIRDRCDVAAGDFQVCCGFEVQERGLMPFESCELRPYCMSTDAQSGMTPVMRKCAVSTYD